ncbi:MarR family transcriptional regulator [Devosia sp. PTR5]|uniref:MarR family transcriptional regulator n=1 Tax=Devosia oryzisoli TaxID=2774138 RepID=A0A927IRB9_9HYPH|nr:MarR family transcriptional regulator [Devosia oryzisoli]MBD8066540.1 MarR family transcriptional regulator [Devosia oryzisoli]
MTLDRNSSVGYVTNLAGRLLVRELERHLSRIGLSPAHMPVLLALDDGSAATQKALAEDARVEQATMAATLARMERDGLIQRTPNPDDGRSSLVRLTPAALEKLPQVSAITRSINALVLEQLTPEERAQFFTLMSKITAVLEAQEKN